MNLLFLVRTDWVTKSFNSLFSHILRCDFSLVRLPCIRCFRYCLGLMRMLPESRINYIWLESRHFLITVLPAAYTSLIFWSYSMSPISFFMGKEKFEPKIWFMSRYTFFYCLSIFKYYSYRFRWLIMLYKLSEKILRI